ncbi:MAG: octaprenyl-diphosphate synthase [Candidatus Tokpelaia sp. JSC161]|nr:MAG: octaprenyl-diphosphate synthase [Candidatus Tokpelaia sp. JSC161]
MICAKEREEYIQPLIELTRDDMLAVNKLICSQTNSTVPIIPKITHHLTSSGGKRLRPMITLAAAKMFGYAGDHHIKLAAAVEFMHTATLLHDDVVDESKRRRGKSTARMVWGNQASVLVGDFLLGQAFKMIVKTRSLPCLHILSNAASIIAEGEVMQLTAAKNIKTTEQEYFAIINAKTATLFSAAAEVGPAISGKDEGTCSALAHYGKNLGLAFQLIDDALDYSGIPEYLGKNTGDDFREGKVTMPLILSFSRSSQKERLFWKQAIEFGENNNTAFAKARTFINKHNSLHMTIQHARRFGEKARRTLLPFDPSPQKDALIKIIDFCITRIN